MQLLQQLLYDNMSSTQPRKQRLARYTAPYHRRHREMAAPIDRGLRERQMGRGFMYPRSMAVRKGDRVIGHLKFTAARFGKDDWELVEEERR